MGENIHGYYVAAYAENCGIDPRLGLAQETAAVQAQRLTGSRCCMHSQ
ncbi:hypothetical protein APH_1236 [Anaplasma phagocytophilum str. HZ]|uniref:Uncharacterized protein n=1 Tax=Anaplasma phagocytophilum (strain HZ) TaxID=212042 RepID=Q2GIN6_ANAPZ|nr:hypothetical protein APH_1236 [Anaplasma phagocytophilum str. HZ]